MGSYPFARADFLSLVSEQPESTTRYCAYQLHQASRHLLAVTQRRDCDGAHSPEYTVAETAGFQPCVCTRI